MKTPPNLKAKTRLIQAWPPAAATFNLPSGMIRASGCIVIRRRSRAYYQHGDQHSEECPEKPGRGVGDFIGVS